MRAILATILTFLYLAVGLIIAIIVAPIVAIGITLKSIPRVWCNLRYGKPKLDLPIIINEAGREVSEEMAKEAQGAQVRPQPQKGKRVDQALADGDIGIAQIDKQGRWRKWGNA